MLTEYLEASGLQVGDGLMCLREKEEKI